MSYLGQNIKKLRQVKGLSQQAFAEIFELKRANISSYEEKRAEPKLEFVIKIANYFSIPLNDFIEKPLSVNEILKFGDYFEDGKVTGTKKLSEIPFLDRENSLRHEQYFANKANLPQLHFPIYSKNELLSIEMNSNIPHHLNFDYEDGAILFFENLDVNNIHLINDALGLFWNEKDLYLGKYQQKKETVKLILNDWKENDFDLKISVHFWVLIGVFNKKEQ